MPRLSDLEPQKGDILPGAKTRSAPGTIGPLGCWDSEPLLEIDRAQELVCCPVLSLLDDPGSSPSGLVVFGLLLQCLATRQDVKVGRQIGGADLGGGKGLAVVRVAPSSEPRALLVQGDDSAHKDAVQDLFSILERSEPIARNHVADELVAAKGHEVISVVDRLFLMDGNVAPLSIATTV